MSNKVKFKWKKNNKTLDSLVKLNARILISKNESINHLIDYLV